MNIDFEVDRLFDEASDRFYSLRTNPVTGGLWANGLDPVAPQKERARRALRARLWFAKNGPPDAPPLPLSYGEREDLKCGDYFLYIVALFARSLAAREYDFDVHPSFEDFARGVLASPYKPYFVNEDEELERRYPPRQLEGLGPGCYWEPRCSTKP